MTQSQEPSTGVNNPDHPLLEPVPPEPDDGQAGSKGGDDTSPEPQGTKKAASANGQPAHKSGSGSSSVTGNLTTTWMSYRALSDVSKTIADNLKDHLGDRMVIIIGGGSALDDLRQWRLFESALSGAQTYCDSVLARYETARPEVVELGIQGGLEAWTAALTAVSGIFALFETKITATQQQFELDETAMISAIAAEILANNPDTIIKSPRSLASRSNSLAAGVEAIAKLMAARMKASVQAAAHKSDAVKTAELGAVVKLVDGIVERVQFFGGGEIARSILSGETINNALSDPGALLLDLKPIIGGGDQISIQRSFFHTEEFHVNGVAAVSYSLVDAEGNVLSTGNVHAHTGYRRYDAVENGVWGDFRKPSATADGT